MRQTYLIQKDKPLTGQQASKNIYVGLPLITITDLLRLADERQSVVIIRAGEFNVTPAAAIIHWSLAILSRLTIFYTVKSTTTI